jgi:Protein of unknown function (DUF3240)
MNAGCLVVLYAPRALEDAIVDLLLSLEAGRGFSSFPVNRHHHESQGLSLAEQVSGRQQQVCFQIQTGEQASDLLVQQIRVEFGGAGIFYQVLPLWASGSI